MNENILIDLFFEFLIFLNVNFFDVIKVGF